MYATSNYRLDDVTKHYHYTGNFISSASLYQGMSKKGHILGQDC